MSRARRATTVAAEAVATAGSDHADVTGNGEAACCLPVFVLEAVPTYRADGWWRRPRGFCVGGCGVTPLRVRASVIVPATGFDGVVGAAQIERLPDGAILMNVGQSHREIDVDSLNQHPHTDLRRHLERYDVNGRRVHLLYRGSLGNLVAVLFVGRKP